MPNPMITAALDLAQHYGWNVFPLQGKIPYREFPWREKSNNAPGLIRPTFAPYKHHPALSIGVDCGKSSLVVIDLDVHGDTNGIESFRALCDEHDIDTSGAVISRTGSGGVHLIFSDPTGGLIRNSASKLGPGIDVRANGGYIVAPPSIHPDTRRPYKWERNGQQPTPLPADLVRLLLAPDPDPEPKPAAPRQRRLDDPGRYAGYVASALDAEIVAVEHAISGTRNDQLFKSAAALGQLVGAHWADLPRSTVETALYNACLSNGLIKDDGKRAVEKTIKSGLDSGLKSPRREPPPLEENPAPIYEEIAPPQPGAEEIADDDIEVAIPAITQYHPEQLPTAVLSAALKRAEMGDAEILARLYPNHLRFDHSDEQWYIWDGVHWEPDRMNTIRHLANRQVGGQYLTAAGKARLSENTDLSSDLAKRASALGNKSRLNNILDLAGSLRTFAMSGEEWDRNPMLLGCKNGVIDLMTGEFRPGDPSDYIQKTAPTKWLGLNVAAPRFEQFLQEIFDGDQELIDFVQRLFGYGITGQNSEAVFAVLWGQGRNGKDTLLEALQHALGPDLADRVPGDVLMSGGSRRGNASPELMELRGRRLAWVSETKQHARLNANQVKDITGRNMLKARPLYGQFVSFPAQYMLMLLTNNKPTIPAEDYAIWQRILLIEFGMSFVEKPTATNERKRDPHLASKLQDEAAGILAWLIRGCLKWQAEGLNPPDVVRHATEQYRREEDTLNLFIRENCIIDKNNPNMYVESSELRSAYNEWASANGERQIRLREFGERMNKSFERDRHPKTRRKTYVGISLLI